MNDISSTLFEKVRPFLRPGMVVLDVGAHDMAYAEKFIAAGCSVIALDNAFPNGVVALPGVTLIEDDFLHFTPTAPVDVVFASYVAQFMGKDEFFRQIARHYADARVIAIRTFYRAPEPPNSTQITFYDEADLTLLPSGFDAYAVTKAVEKHADMRGNPRTFYEIDFLATRGPAEEQERPHP